MVKLFRISIAAVASLLIALTLAWAQTPAPPYAPWVNVPITYRIRVLWLLDVGSLTFSLKPDTANPRRFTVVSEAHPIDIIRKITQFRDARYTAVLNYDEKTDRFSVSEVREFVRRADRTREVRLDIRPDGWSRRAFHNDKLASEQTGTLKPGEMALDPVAAFYNFLLGAYGPPADSHDYRVPMFSRTGPANAIVSILPRPEAREILNLKSAQEFGGRVTFDGSFMDLKVKEVLFVTNDHFLPIRAVVRDAGYLGQVEAFRTSPKP
ncbi:MAG: hypothetical protein HYT87_17955 [Nitrospirae bacterium]|nr:hypothetical protein [Nitrospirota bacterium]